MRKKNVIEAPSRPYCSAVIVAAGNSTRMGEDKLLLPLDGEPAIALCLSAFQASPVIDEIVVVTRSEKIPLLADICRSSGITKAKCVTDGGDTRAASALRGVRETSEGAELIAIHDGARPLVTPELIERVVFKAAEIGAAAPVIRVKDTVRQARGGLLIKTLPREELVFMQTPQVFRAELIRAALADCVKLGVELTDDCQAVMLEDAPVAEVDGSAENLKLTTPEDVIVAQSILNRRREQ